MAGCFKKALVPATPIFMAFVGMLMGFGANTWCNFVKIKTKANFAFPQYGIWGHTEWGVYEDIWGDLVVYESCKAYPDEMEVDSDWKIAKAFSIIALVVGGVSTAFVTIGTFVNLGNTIWRVTALGFFVATLSQGLTFMFLQSNVCERDRHEIINEIEEQLGREIDFEGFECELEWGGKYSVAATLFFFLTGVAMLAFGVTTFRRDDESIVEQSPITRGVGIIQEEEAAPVEEDDGKDVMTEDSAKTEAERTEVDSGV